MHPTARRLAAGSLAAVAVLAAGPLATAGAKGGVPKVRPAQPQVPQVPQVPQLPQVPQAPQAPRLKIIVPLNTCAGVTKGKVSYEQNALGNFVTAEVNGAAPGTALAVVVNGTLIGGMVADAAGTARQVFTLATPLATPIVSAQIVGANTLAATLC